MIAPIRKPPRVPENRDDEDFYSSPIGYNSNASEGAAFLKIVVLLFVFSAFLIGGLVACYKH